MQQHRLVSSIPGEEGRLTPNGRYECTCGEILPGNNSFMQHRRVARRAEAIERGARALFTAMRMEAMSNLTNWDDVYVSEATRNVYRTRAAVVIDAAGYNNGGNRNG